MAVAPIPQVRKVLEYGLTQIPSDKILMGIPNYGYDWPLPYIKGYTKARKLGHREAYLLAVNQGVPIEYDPVSQSPFFRYSDIDGIEHEVWFEDERSLREKFNLVEEYNLSGLSFWNIMTYHYETDFLLNNQFEIISL